MAKKPTRDIKLTPREKAQVDKAIEGIKAKTIRSGAKFSGRTNQEVRADLISTIARQRRTAAKKKKK